MLLLALAIAACGSSSNSSSSSQEVGTKSENVKATSGKPAELAESTWVVPEEWDAIDPTRIAATNESAILLVLEPLILPNPEGGAALPNLAHLERPDPSTYVFNIRKGVKFTDGNPLTVEDVIYSLNLHLEKGSTSNLASLRETVKSLKQTGPDQITITLKKPDLTFEDKIAQAGIVEKSVREKLGDHPGAPGSPNVGTGPYTVETFKPGNELVLQRNESYWGKKPALKTIKLRLIEDESSELLAARSGELTGAFETPPSQANVYEEVPGMHLISGYNPSVVMFNMDTTKAPWNDIHVRRAIALSIDREGLVQSIVKGKGEVAPSVVQQSNAEEVLSKPEATKLYEEFSETNTFDLKKAEEEMAKSKTPDGFTETVIYDQSQPDTGKVAQVLAQEVKPLGINLKVKEVPDSQYLNAVFFEHTMTSAIVDFTTDILDPISLPNYLTNSVNLKENGGYTDIANWSSPEMDKILNTYLEGNSQTEKPRQAKLLTEALKIMNEEETYVPIYHADYLALVKDGLTFNDFNGFWWEYRWPELIREEAE
jgi:peptide/nickel transport system substrate-binding protein